VVHRGPSFAVVPFLVRYSVCFSKFSFHGCNYGILIGWCSYSFWTICIHSSRKCYTSCLTDKPLQSPEHITVWMTLTRTTCRVFPCISNVSIITDTESQKHVSFVYSVVIRSKLSPAVGSFLSTHNNAIYCCEIYNTAEKCVAPFDGHLDVEN
jgi:hypothetical protein